MEAAQFILPQYHLELVINSPAAVPLQGETPANDSEIIRQLYFYNRQYVAITLRQWLVQRQNVYKHVKDGNNVNMTGSLIESMDKYKSTSLDQLCGIVVKRTHRIKQVAPNSQSPFYKKYEEVIEPILRWCHKWEGLEYE